MAQIEAFALVQAFGVMPHRSRTPNQPMGASPDRRVARRVRPAAREHQFRRNGTEPRFKAINRASVLNRRDFPGHALVPAVGWFYGLVVLGAG